MQENLSWSFEESDLCIYCLHATKLDKSQLKFRYKYPYQILRIHSPLLFEYYKIEFVQW